MMAQKTAQSAVARLAGADVLIHNRNQGKGVALENGLAYALSLDVDAVVAMDGDGQHRPNEIPDLVRPILDEEADMVIGSRFRDVKSKIPWWRQIGQHALTYVTNTTSQIKSTDSQSGFRAFSRQAVESMDLRSTGFSVESELQFIACENQLAGNRSADNLYLRREGQAKPVPTRIPGSFRNSEAGEPVTTPVLFWGSRCSCGFGWYFMVGNDCRDLQLILACLQSAMHHWQL
jgi:glycosyltransferase involved in cell wall biosynthesis